MDKTRQRQIATAIGARLARKRQAAGLTQEDVAERLGVGNEAISRMERGVAAPTVARLFEFAELYRCRVDHLLSESSDREIDQAAALTERLSKLGPMERLLVTQVVDRLTSHFVEFPGNRRRD